MFKCLEGIRENIYLLNQCKFTLFTTISVHYLAMALFSKCCISETAALLCMCDAPLESLLYGLIGGKFTLRRGTMNTQRTHPIMIDVFLVKFLLCLGKICCVSICWRVCETKSLYLVIVKLFRTEILWSTLSTICSTTLVAVQRSISPEVCVRRVRTSSASAVVFKSVLKLSW